MGDDETFKPVFLSAIGRSGTFIIETAAPEKVKNGNSLESSTYDQQKETPMVENKLKPRAQASLENNNKGPADVTIETGSAVITTETESTDITTETGSAVITTETGSTDFTTETGSAVITAETGSSAVITSETGSADITTETGGNTEAPERNDNVSTEAETRTGKTESRNTSTGNTEKVLKHETTGTKIGGGTKFAGAFTVDSKIVELNDSNRNSKSKLPEVSTNPPKVESPEEFCKSEQTPEIEPRRGINESPDVSTERDRSTSSGKSSLPSKKLRPTPAPRKSVVKKPDESADKYVLLHKDLCDRWNAVAQVPKFQSIDNKTMAILQEQANRRLMALYPPSYVEDFKTLIKKVEDALKRFYDQEIDNNQNIGETHKLKSTGTGLPTLKFLQWVLSSLDQKAQDLLFGCDNMTLKVNY